MTSISSTASATTVSAPGKALIAGGYLVLESPNPGLVLATDSCFHVTITTKPIHSLDLSLYHSNNNDTDGNNNSNDSFSFPLDVYSPQFHAIYTYTVSVNKNTSSSSSSSTTATSQPFVSLQPRYNNQSNNSYIEKTIIVTISSIIIATDVNTFIDSIRSSLPDHEHEPEHEYEHKEEAALAIILRADNDFYSIIPHLKEYKLNPLPSDIEKLPSFLPCPKKKMKKKKNIDSKEKEHNVDDNNNDEDNDEDEEVIVEVNKTGLGSSAALVTSLVGALLVHFNIVSIPTMSSSCIENNSSNSCTNNNDDDDDNNHNENTNNYDGLKIIHNLAQICHSFAQGKIGSGFDVSAAVYGSHVYTRFDKSVITSVMDQLSNDLSGNGNGNGSDNNSTISTNTGEAIWDCVCDSVKWNALVEPLNLPHGLQLLMADICGGSESPSMAKKVLAWKKEKEEEERDESKDGDGATEWLELMKINMTLKNLFQEAAKITSSSLLSSRKKFTNDENDDLLESLLIQIRDSIQHSRKYLKAMGEAAGVPIEPEEQTKLADDTMNIPGVIATGVPGAGGYDALFVLYKEEDGKDGDEVRDRIGKFWMDWCDERQKDGLRGVVCPLASKCVGYGKGLRNSHLE